MAESFEQARDAAGRVTAVYVEEKPTASWKAASGAVYAPELVDGEKATTAILDKGVSSIDEVLKKSEVNLEVTYTEPIYHHNPMEPHATTAVWEAERLRPGMFALECAMDELAVKLGMDPIELRIRNNAEIYPGKNLPWSSKNLTECYRLGAEQFGWSKRQAEPCTLKDGDWNLGMGMATALYSANRGIAAAKVRLQADGAARISSATHDLGTGMWTVMAIVGSESLGLPMDRIWPELGDSSLPVAPVAGGSQSTASVSPAIKKAAESVKAKLIQLAAKEKRSPFHGIDPREISFVNGELVAGDKHLEFGALLKALGRGFLAATETSESGEEAKRFAFHSFGAQFCEVKVNKWTSEIRVNRVTSVMDIGTVINLKTARSQVIGGIGMPAAIANAVFNATGIRVRDFPIDVEKLIRPGQGVGRIS